MIDYRVELGLHTDRLYDIIMNDAAAYKESETIRLAMQKSLLAGTYTHHRFIWQFANIAKNHARIERIAKEMTEFNDGDETDAWFLRQHRSDIGDGAGKYLEEYYRIELCLQLNIPIIHSGHCETCKKAMSWEQQEESIHGRYCSDLCYELCFANCVICGQRNMTCVTNARTPYIREAKLEQACDACLLKKYNLSICTIVCDCRD